MLSCCWDLVDGTLADEDANSKFSFTDVEIGVCDNLVTQIPYLAIFWHVFGRNMVKWILCSSYAIFLQSEFSNVYSNCLPENRRCHIGYMCMILLQSDFSNAPQIACPDKMSSDKMSMAGRS